MLNNRRTKSLLKNINKTIYKYGLIQNGDRVAVAVSGGKDSFTLLHLLNIRRHNVNENYEIFPLNIAFDGKRNEKLEELVNNEDLKLKYLKVSTEDLINSRKGEIDCFRCSWVRRKAMFEWVTKNKINKLAFGHHMDDSNETALLNLFFHGKLEPLDVKAEFFKGKLTVIRPIIFFKESEIRSYIRPMKEIFKSCNCGFVDSSKRDFAKNLIKELKKSSKSINMNIWKASKLWEKHIEKPDDIR